MSYFKHSHSLVKSEQIGSNSRIWAFAHVLPGARIDADCNICDHVFIENDVIIGDRVTIKCGVHIWDGIRLENDVVVGPNATFTNDLFQRRKQPFQLRSTVVERCASIGANAPILYGITIGAEAMIGAGSVVTRDAPPERSLSVIPAASSDT